jgi:hypothetical protein
MKTACLERAQKAIVCRFDALRRGQLAIPAKILVVCKLDGDDRDLPAPAVPVARAAPPNPLRLHAYSLAHRSSARHEWQVARASRRHQEEIAMEKSREGGCQCGAVRYRLDGEPVLLGVCHCRECQRQSGSAFGMSLIMSKEHFTLLRGTLKRFTRSSDSGRPLICSFCPECGTRIHHEPAYLEGVINVKPGTLDDTSWLKPIGQAWTASKQPWVDLGAELPAFAGQPDMQR